MVRSAVALVLAGAGLFAAGQPSTVVAPPFTGAQAEAGRATFQANCASCHRDDLSGSRDAPPLAGEGFMNAWRNRTTRELLEYMQSAMPPTSPGTLGEQGYVNVLAHVLQVNGVQAGAQAMTAGTAIEIGTLPLGRSQTAAAQQTPAAPAQAGGGGRGQRAETIGPNSVVKNFTPVTDAMLLNPPPGDWLNWRRTLDGWGYSPLNQINTQNAHQLQLVWSWGLGPGDSQPTPLVHDGIMYVPSPQGLVQAIDAETGEFIWEYKKSFEVQPTFLTMMRSIAIYGDKIFVSTHDAHLVALNARTGAVVWDRTIADYKLGYRYTSGPIIVGGKVVAGMTGCDRYKNDVCFISAHDAQTGKQVWRTSTIARPGEPGGETWGSRPLVYRAGADAWVPGSYDPATNLIFWSTSQAKPWARAQRGASNEEAELYTNSTLALNPDTGKIVWYHQFIPGDSHDQDEVYESILLDHNGRQSLFKMGKLGILWELDRTTGKFVTASDLGYQTIFEMNPLTGKLTYRPGLLQKINAEIDYCPTIHGMKNWRAMAYHPATRAFYVPMFLSCEQATYTEVEQKEGGGGNGRISGSKQYIHPAAAGKTGQFLAMDVTGKPLWRHETRLPMASAALTTGGGLAIVGDTDRYVYVHDAASGKILFQSRLPTAAQGFPITYAVKGKQYLAIPVGTGPASWIGIGARLTQTKAPPPINAIFVFALRN
jgi:alcohol dehydrogenase (cytochrome c)